MRRLLVLLAVLVGAAFGAAPAAAAVHSGALASAGMAAAHGADVVQVAAPVTAPAAPAAATALEGVPAYAAAAAQYWGAVPACGMPTFSVDEATPPDPLVQPDSEAWVVPSEQQAGGCVIHLLAAFWNGPADPAFDCRLIAHEYGHELGLWDVDDPSSIEDHVVSVLVPDAPCDALGVTARS